MTNKTLRIATAALALASTTAVAQHKDTPVWLESDSAAAIQNRIRSDFSMSPEEARDAINKKYGLKLTTDSIREYGRRHYIEIMNVDGKERVFHKSVRNLALLHPAMNGNNPPRGARASEMRIAYVDSILNACDKGHGPGAGHRIRYRFAIDVPYNEALDGDTLRVWMPYPMQTERQHNIRTISMSPQGSLTPTNTGHNSIYFSAPVEKGKDAHFEYVVEYDTYGQYFNPEYILKNLRPYDKSSDLYKRYTAPEAPHIIHDSGLAHKIVGNETNPYRQSEMVYDYIINRYPWAGAREYSTIPCIPQYVIDEKHGDCGQVSLLYISLMRSLGVPARWESGWMLHPDEVNLHDWAEVYFEGVGWVPVDTSFGRYTAAKDPRARKFYSTGMDAWRLAANKTVSGPFNPAKKYVRSETVDAQLGEVETSRGNLFYPAWKRKFTVLSTEVLDAPLPANSWALPRVSVAHGRENPSHAAEMGTQMLMGMPLRILQKKGDWYLVESPEGYRSWVIDNLLTVKTPEQMEAWRKAPRLIVTAPYQTRAFYTAKGNGPRDVVTDLVLGDIVEGELKNAVNGRVKITLPDNRTAWVSTADVEPLDKWAQQNFDAQKILDTAYSMEGSPYFWGGTSIKNLDCSGLSKVSYLSNGIILLRNASQQAKTGTRIEAKDWRTCRPGDLLFFGNKKTGKVTHVAIYDHDGNYIHSSARVRRNSVDPESPDYLTTDFLHAVRIDGNEGTPGITRVREHPWYF